MVRDEQREYTNEGIAWHEIPFKDNQHVLALLEVSKFEFEFN